MTYKSLFILIDSVRRWQLGHNSVT